MSLQACLSIVGLVAALIIIGELKFHRSEERERAARLFGHGEGLDD